MRADLEWPVAYFDLRYRPIVTMGVQGRIGPPSRTSPIGLDL